MYAVTCKSGTPKAGDMATVVINYPSLEAAASKLNAVIAVAMEYGAATCTNSPIANCEGAIANRRFPKFYVFAPDDRDGSFHRVQSLSFDHRGEKYVPGACVMCHGGTLPTFQANFAHVSQHAAAANPNQASTYPTVGDPTKTSQTIANLGFGDIDATFIPWDLDSLLYSEAPQAANQDLSYVGLSVKPITLFTDRPGGRAEAIEPIRLLHVPAGSGTGRRHCADRSIRGTSGSGGPMVRRYAGFGRNVWRGYQLRDRCRAYGKLAAQQWLQ